MAWVWPRSHLAWYLDWLDTMDAVWDIGGSRPVLLDGLNTNIGHMRQVALVGTKQHSSLSVRASSITHTRD